LEKVKLSTKGRYAVMAMADLARHCGAASDIGAAPQSLTAIAKRQEISLAYLEQLFAKLRRAGLVTGVRGPGGGFKLARPAEELRIADIVLAVDEPLKATRCEGHGPVGCLKRGNRCLTHDLWDELGTQIEYFLSSVTLADVIERRVRGRAQALAGSRLSANEHAVV
jgi:Rrf2 family iron-sulfur cluster assembly transcriptional regulator